jgi:2-polyprenyl-3-methyl-5-hydroxy-6-metoxy-1,4-benzoquinol methylase
MNKYNQFDISLLTSQLVLKDGIWFPPEKAKISYPDSGNINCLQIEENSFWFRHRSRCISLLVKRFSKDVIFWDIGGGNGFVAKGLQNEGIEVVLVEPGEKGANTALKRGVRHVICSTLEQASLKPNSLLAAGMFDVIEHIEDDVAFLKMVHSSMPSRGHVYITVPAYQALWSHNDEYAGHFRRYTLNSLKKNLQAAGFEPVYKTYIFSVLIIPILIFRTVAQKLFKSKAENVGKIEKDQQEHTDSGLLTQLMKPFWNLEFWLIKQKMSIPFGGSCLIVAKKK